jgi:hypothetical protein
MASGDVLLGIEQDIGGSGYLQAVVVCWIGDPALHLIGDVHQHKGIRGHDSH